MARKFDILSAGLMVYDIIISPVDETVFTKDTTQIKNVAFASGGDALNVAVGAARLGKAVCLGGIVGNDAPGKYLKEVALGDNIDISGVGTSKTSQTSVSVVLCREGGQRHFAYYGRANNEFDGSAISDALLADTSLLYIGSMMALGALEYGPLCGLFRRAKEQGCLTAMDTTWPKDGVWLEKFAGALEYTDIFVPSLYEAEQICKSSSPSEIVAFLHSQGVKIAGVKLGGDGVYIEGEHIPAFRCDNVVDTTGAGDSFMAGFVSGISEGLSPEKAAMLGSAAANCCIRSLGAVTGAPDREKAENVIALHKSGKLN